MDQPNLNIRQHKWLDVVKDYKCKVLYHPRKANMVVDALSRKVTSALLRDLSLRMTVITLLLDKIHSAQVKAIKVGQRRTECIVGQVSSFHYDSWGLLTLHQRFWVLYLGRSR